MLRKARELGYISAAQFEEFIKRDPDSREREVFGATEGRRVRGGARAGVRRPIFSDRYRLLEQEVSSRPIRLTTLYAADRNSRWFEYWDFDPSRDFADLLAEVEADPTGIFWG